MINSTVMGRLNTIFYKASQAPSKKSTGKDCGAEYDLNRERDRFQSLSGNSEARDGTYDVSATNHPFAPPFRTQVQLNGDLDGGTIARRDALYLDLPVRTTGEPTFLTTSHTHFSDESMIKLEAVEGPEGTTARRIFADYDEPEKNYVEEYFIAP